MEKIKRVLLINGCAGAGKDTFVKCLNEIVPTYHYSIVDCVKDILSPVDNGMHKTEKYRKLVSDVKLALESYNDYPYRNVTSVVCDFFNDDLPHELLCIDMREPHNIERAKKDFNALSILVEQDGVKPILSNVGDASVYESSYNFTVNNSSDLKNLKREAERLVGWLTENEYI